MDYKKLTEFLKEMLNNTIPTFQLVNQKPTNSIDFWGNDSKGWLLSEAIPPIEINTDSSSNESFSIINNGLTAYDNFKKELNKNPKIDQYIGTKTLEDSIERLLRHYYKNDQTSELITESIKKEIKEILDSIKEWTAFAPVDFLIFIDLKELQIGNITFQIVTEVIDDIMTEFRKRIDANVTTNEEKETLKNALSQSIPSLFNHNSVVAKVNIEGESNRLKYIAEEEIETALNLLRCYTYVLYSRELKVKMGLRFTTGYYMRPSMGFSLTDDSWTLGYDNIGLNQNFEITKANIKLLKQKYALDILYQNKLENSVKL